MIDVEIILASKSQTRFDIIKSAGLNVKQEASNIDENYFKKTEKDPRKLSLLLAQEKAKHTSKNNNKFEGFVIGSDQVLAVGNKSLNKVRTIDDAYIQLKELSGKTHHLLSSISIFQNQREVFQHIETCKMEMLTLDSSFIYKYLEKTGPKILNSVGCYHYEGIGSQLFSKVAGDYYSILGLPLMPILKFLRVDQSK